MFKQNKSRFNLRLLIVVMAIIAVICVAPLMAAGDEFALLVQKSPEHGGVVTPVEGLQMASGDQLVTITATPRDGYEFVYWLGDVASPTSSITSVVVDTPKMVIAVFERPEVEENHNTSGSFSGGGGSRSSGPMTSSSSFNRSLVSAGPTSATGSSSPTTTTTPFDPPIYYNPGDPGGETGGSGGGPEVPEPATMLLMGSGVLMLIKKRKNS